MPEAGHFQALRALIARHAARGLTAYVFTHRNFAEEVASCGGQFVDLFGKYSLDEADSRSRPIPCRYVSFAGHFADRVIEDIQALDPALIVYETFSVIGPVVARAIGVPSVNVCVNHNPHPIRCLMALEQDPRVAISEQCQRAVERLRTRFGLANASPFSYVLELSHFLNVYCEPPQFLDPEDWATFEPLGFFGCLPDSPVRKDGPPPVSYFDERSPNELRVYVSLGTVIWRYFAHEAYAALQAISQACAELDHVRALISLGGPGAAEVDLASLSKANVRVEMFVDQCSVLDQADVFVTHHGINSTHEAIARRVPMLSYPFFSDQPALARKCQSLGVAMPLGDGLGVPLHASHVKAALAMVQRRAPSLQACLARACQWETETIAARELVMQRIEDLIKQ